MPYFRLLKVCSHFRRRSQVRHNFSWSHVLLFVLLFFHFCASGFQFTKNIVKFKKMFSVEKHYKTRVPKTDNVNVKVLVVSCWITAGKSYIYTAVFISPLFIQIKYKSVEGLHPTETLLINAKLTECNQNKWFFLNHKYRGKACLFDIFQC